MSEPRRLKHETRSALARTLLESAEADRSCAGARERVLGAMGVGVSAVVISASVASVAAKATASGAAPATKGIGLIVAKWVALAMLGSGVVVGVRHQMYVDRVTSVVATPVTVPSPSVPPPLTLAVAAAPSADEPSPLPVTPAPVRVAEPAASPPIVMRRRGAARAAQAASAVASAAPTAAVSTASEQTRALAAVRAQIAERDGPRALASLDDFEARYPKSRFAEEVSVLRIDALLASGRREEAVTRGQVFLLRIPDSAYARHVQSALAVP